MIGTSTGEVYEDSVDHLLDTSNKRVSDSFSDLKPENPVIETPPKPKEAGMGAEMAGGKAATWTAWLASLPTSYAGAATKVTGAMSGVEAALTMYKMKTEIVDDVRKQVKAGTPIDKIKFEDGSAADGYGLFSSLQNHFKKPIEEIKPGDQPLRAVDDVSKSPYTPLTEQEHKDLMWDTPVPSSKDPVFHEGTPQERRQAVEEILNETPEERQKQFDEAKKAWGDQMLDKEPSPTGRFRMWKDIPAIQEYLKDLPRDVRAHDMRDGTIILRKVDPSSTDTPMMSSGEDDSAQRDSYNFFKALNDATNPEAFKSAMSRWPLSKNIEDRRGEAPIASRTREDWGKGGLLPAMDSDRLKMGKPLMEIPSGAGGSYPAQNLRPIELDNAVTSWAQGKLQAKEVQKIFKDKGWTLDLRRGRYDVEAFDPSGKAHYIQP